MQIKPLERTLMGVVVFNAMCEETDNKPDLKAKYKIQSDQQGKPLEVELTVLINGVPIDFEAAFERAVTRTWNDITGSLDKLIEDKAVELLQASGLQDLAHEIESAEWKIREALEKVGAKV